MTYTIQQAIGNYSTDLETFDNMDEASEWLEDRVNSELLEEYKADGIDSLCELDNELLDMARETALSYYSIEENEEPEAKILDYFYKGIYTAGAEKMLEYFISPNSLINWLLDQREELGETYFDSIDLLAVVSIVESYNQARLRHD